MSNPRDDNARNTGRGFLLITGAKAWFFVAAALLNFGLPWLLASQAEYGVYGVVTNTVSLINMVVITASLQAVSKLVSEQPELAPGVVRSGLRLQLLVGLPLAAAYAALAGPIADALRDPGYAPLLRISAVIVASYSFYAVFVGYFNGLRAFGRQAALDILFSTLRVTCILGAVAAGFGVMGAIAGFSAASVMILVVSALLMIRHARASRRGAPAEDHPAAPSTRRLAGFLAAIMLYTFLLNGVIRVDLFLLKRVSADNLAHLPLADDLSNALAGCYNLMLNIARLPYQGVIAITFVIFPVISRSTFEDDADATRNYIRATMRYTFLLVVGVAVVLAASGADLIRPLYPDYAYGSGALTLLCLAYVCFSLLYVGSTLLIAAGRPLLASALTGAALLACAFGCALLLEQARGAEGFLEAAAGGVLIGMAAGVIVTAVALIRLYGAFVPWATLIRVTAIAGAILALGYVTRFDQFATIVDPVPALTDEGFGRAQRMLGGSRLQVLLLAGGRSAALFVVYLLLLWVTREFGEADRARVERLLKRDRA